MNRLRRRVLARSALLGLSQQQLARLISMDESQLSRAIRAEYPRAETLERIGRALDLSVDELCGEDDLPIVRPHRGVVHPQWDDWEAQIGAWLSRGGTGTGTDTEPSSKLEARSSKLEE